jgi:hypothetical protein
VVAGVCIDCGHPIGSGKRACPNCGCPEPMPTKARHKCVACGSGIMSMKQPCTHCGAPDPADPGPIVPAVIRCAQCGNPTHVAAESCRKCRMPSGSFNSSISAPAFQESVEINRAAAEARAISTAMGRQPSSLSNAARGASTGLPPSPTALAAPLWDPTRNPLETMAGHPGQRRVDLDSEQADKPSIFPALFPSLSATAEPPTAALVNRVPCGRCGELQARGTRTCVRCGVADPETADPVERRKPLFGFVHIPTVPAIVTIVGLLALGGFTIFTSLTKEEERKHRIWLALGAKADEMKVAEVEKEAAYIGVSTDVLLRVRFFCLHREQMRPSTAVMRQARANAERDGRDSDNAVSDLARGACGR